MINQFLFAGLLAMLSGCKSTYQSLLGSEKKNADFDIATIRSAAKIAEGPEGFLRVVLEKLNGKNSADFDWKAGDGFVRFFLIYESRSRQVASILKPRVVLFNHDADVIVAFEGANDDTDIEVNWREEVTLANGKKTLTWNFGEVEFGKGVTPKAECATCHHGRPNWDGYNVWRGVYGSGIAIAEKEEGNLKSFEAENRNKFFYKMLRGDPKTDSFIGSRGFAMRSSDDINSFTDKLFAQHNDIVVQDFFQKVTDKRRQFALMSVLMCKDYQSIAEFKQLATNAGLTASLYPQNGLEKFFVDFQKENYEQLRETRRAHAKNLQETFLGHNYVIEGEDNVRDAGVTLTGLSYFLSTPKVLPDLNSMSLSIANDPTHRDFFDYTTATSAQQDLAVRLDKIWNTNIFTNDEKAKENVIEYKNGPKYVVGFLRCPKPENFGLSF